MKIIESGLEIMKNELCSNFKVNLNYGNYFQNMLIIELVNTF